MMIVWNGYRYRSAAFVCPECGRNGTTYTDVVHKPKCRQATKVHLYFAYGSNLDTEQMAERCPGSKLIGRARLDDYRLTFVGWSKNWQGGVANILPEEGGAVEGVVYEVPDSDMATLDRYEGAPTVYRRARVMVTDAKGKQRRVTTYLRDDVDFSKPSSKYLDKIKNAYRAHGIKAKIRLASTESKFDGVARRAKVLALRWTLTDFNKSWLSQREQPNVVDGHEYFGIALSGSAPPVLLEEPERTAELKRLAARMKRLTGAAEVDVKWFGNRPQFLLRTS